MLNKNKIFFEKTEKEREKASLCEIDQSNRLEINYAKYLAYINNTVRGDVTPPPYLALLFLPHLPYFSFPYILFLLLF